MSHKIDIAWSFVIGVECLLLVGAAFAFHALRKERMWEAFTEGERALQENGATELAYGWYHAAARRGHWPAACREALCAMLGASTPEAALSQRCPEHGRDVLACMKAAGQAPNELAARLSPAQIGRLDVAICNQIVGTYRACYGADLPRRVLRDDGCLYRAACEGDATWAAQDLWRAFLEPQVPKDRACFEKGFRPLKIAAAQGDVEAAYLLGRLYKDSEFVEQDLEASTKWLKQAAEADHADAKVTLGRHYLYGIGCARDVRRAAQTLSSVIDRLPPKMTFEVGRCYLEGDGVAEDQESARTWLRLAAKKGNATAQSAFVESCLRDGSKANPQDRLERHWVLNEIAAGNWSAVALYEHTWPEDLDVLADTLHDRAMAGSLDAQCWLGTYWRRMGDNAQARDWYELAAAQGDTQVYRALMELCLADGYDRAALSWARKIRQGGDASVDGILGELLYAGRGAACDYGEAFGFLLNAAARGDANAQWRLWQCYRDGKGVEANAALARQYLDSAAAAEHLPAMTDLGSLLLQGGKSAEEKQSGLSLLHVAAQRGERRAQEAVLRHCVDTDRSPETVPEAGDVWQWIHEATEADSALACYAQGKWRSTTAEEAYESYLRSAQLGCREGILAVAECCAAGRGVKQSLREAIKWYEQVAGQDTVDVCNTLGHLYYAVAESESDYAASRKWYGMAAAQGLAEAQYALGVLCETGKGGAVDLAQAASWYEKAGDQKHAKACYQLGCLYLDGNGVAKDEQRALALFRQAAESGNPQANYRLGLCHYRGQGTPKDPEKAVQCLKKAAERDYAAAQFMLGEFARGGVGMPKNYEKAAAYYKQASDGGSPVATLRLGDCYARGQGVRKDTAQAFVLYRQAEKNADARLKPEIWWKLGRCYANGVGVLRDEEKGLSLLLQASEAGESRAYCDVGHCHYRGIGTKQDFEEAIQWFQKALDSGDSRGAYWLGECAASGAGVPLDDARAVAFYRQAAEAGQAEAQLKMCLHYREGWGVEQDDEEATQWLMKAAKQGHPRAEYLLALAYANGEGIEESEEWAFQTMLAAATHGYVPAQKQLGDWYEEGYGTRRNRKLAEQWRSRAAGGASFLWEQAK